MIDQIVKLTLNQNELIKIVEEIFNAHIVSRYNWKSITEKPVSMSSGQ